MIVLTKSEIPYTHYAVWELNVYVSTFWFERYEYCYVKDSYK